MGSETNAVEKFDPSTLMEGVRDRIKATFISMIPDLEKFMKETDEAEKGDDVSQFKDPYVNLEIPDTNFTVQVKLEGEGVVVDVFLTSSLNLEEPQSVASVWKLYDEMANPDQADDEGTPE